MCVQIIINRGEKELNTTREFIDHFKFIPKIEFGYEELNLDSCLCQVNIEESLEEHNIPFLTFFGDFYVGMLDGMERD